MELLNIDKVEKGSVSMSSNVKSINERWFRKESKAELSKGDFEKEFFEGEMDHSIRETGSFSSSLIEEGLS